MISGRIWNAMPFSSDRPSEEDAREVVRLLLQMAVSVESLAAIKVPDFCRVRPRDLDLEATCGSALQHVCQRVPVQLDVQPLHAELIELAAHGF